MSKQEAQQLEFGPIEIRDTDPHDLPDLDGDDLASAQDAVDVTDKRKIIAKVVSTLDAPGTFKLEGATQEDEAMEEMGTDTTASIEEGDSTEEVEYIFTDVNWSYVKTQIQMDASPTTGDLKVVIQAGK